MSRGRTQDSTPDYRPGLGVKRVERYISTGDKVYRSHYSVNWHGSNRCSACHAYGSLRTGRSRLTKVERPECRVVQICCMFVAIPRAPVDHAISNSRLCGNGAGCRMYPFELKVRCRHWVDDSFRTVKATVTVVEYIRWPVT